MIAPKKALLVAHEGMPGGRYSGATAMTADGAAVVAVAAVVVVVDMMVVVVAAAAMTAVAGVLITNNVRTIQRLFEHMGCITDAARVEIKLYFLSRGLG